MITVQGTNHYTLVPLSVPLQEVMYFPMLLLLLALLFATDTLALWCCCWGFPAVVSSLDSRVGLSLKLWLKLWLLG
jgi:hypothetical protein